MTPPEIVLGLFLLFPSYFIFFKNTFLALSYQCYCFRNISWCN